LDATPSTRKKAAKSSADSKLSNGALVAIDGNVDATASGQDATLEKSGAGGNATIMDVARLAAVSKKTVSRVINDSELVQPETRERVLNAIARLHYVPDPQARGLSSRYAYLIGMVFDNPTAQYVVSMQYGILDGLKNSGFELVVHPCDSKQPDYVEGVKEFVRRQRLFGVVMVPRVSEDENLALAMQELGVHYIRIAAVALDDPSNMIITNDRRAGFEAAQYFESLGHKHMAMITGPGRYRSALERSSGFREGLRTRGLELKEQCVYEGGYTFESGVTGAQVLLSQTPRPTAIFAANDQMAAGVYKVAHRMGIAIPEQLSVIGYDDSPLAVQLWPALTTCHVPVRALGQEAARALLSKRNAIGGFTGSAIQPSLVVRDSVQPPQA